MANPPPKKKINVEDIPGAPEWLGRVVEPLNLFIEATNVALDRGVTYDQNFSGEVKTVSFTAPSEWTNITFNSGYAQVSNPDFIRSRYKKCIMGRVEIEAAVAVTGGFGNAASNIMWTLPPGYRPSGTLVDTFIRNDGGASGVAQVRATGDVYARFGSGNADYSMRTIFTAADTTPPRWDKPLLVKLGTPSRPFPGRPGHVLVLGCRKNNQSLTPVMTYSVDWSATTIDGKDPAIQIHKVWGVQEGLSYNLSLLITPE